MHCAACGGAAPRGSRQDARTARLPTLPRRIVRSDAPFNARVIGSTLPLFHVELLVPAPDVITGLTLAAHSRVRFTHLALLPAAVPRHPVFHGSPGLASALAPSRPLRPVTLRMTSILYIC